jgi:mannitol-specific phosphotransferase system IIBC component
VSTGKSRFWCGKITHLEILPACTQKKESVIVIRPKTAEIVYTCLFLIVAGAFIASLMEMSLHEVNRFQVGIYMGVANFFASIIGMWMALVMRRPYLAIVTMSKMASIAVLVLYNQVLYCIIAVAIEIAIFIAYIMPIQSKEGVR